MGSLTSNITILVYISPSLPRSLANRAMQAGVSKYCFSPFLFFSFLVFMGIGGVWMKGELCYGKVVAFEAF